MEITTHIRDNLFYEGKNFQELLDWFKLAVQFYGAVGYNMDLYNLVKEAERAGAGCYSLFFQGFPKDMQQAIKHEMVRSNLIPYGKDGYPKTPHLEDLWDVGQDKKLNEKKGDGKKREKMIKEKSLASKVNNQLKGEYSRGNDCPSGKLYDLRPSQKDEREGLVKRDGRSFILPSRKCIPCDTSRPIQSVLSTESAKRKPQVNTVSVFEIK
ncbi:hypothetical protein VP01_3246g2 [Puccinia sorghi]|uniref:Uncharacterized protein n=1 Tax=Puccinia sorghi TaxID=27349 RepID=A0A0L6UZY7_9BASI|nr:hypothetical protein VP01_3246g2 [Puccinia sorghi]